MGILAFMSDRTDWNLRGAMGARGRIASVGPRLFTPQVCGVLVLIGAALVAEWLVGLGVVPPGVVARPSDALLGLFTLGNKVDLVGAIFTTFTATVVAVVLELIVALPLGYFLFRFRAFGLAYTNWLAA